MRLKSGTREYTLAIAALFFGSLTAFGAEYCVQPIIPLFTEEFNVDPTISSLAVSLGLAGMAVSMFLIAIFAKRLPRKKIMSWGLIIASGLAMGISLSGNFDMILGMRFIQGMLLAGFPAMAIAYINEEFDPSIIGRVTGIYIAGNSIGGLSGRLMLSALTDLFDWRLALMVLGGIYIAIGFAFSMTLPAPRHEIDLRAEPARPRDFINLLKNWRLVCVYLIATLAMGAFVCSYNFISYVLLAAPYSLTQTQIGFVYTLFLVGTFASTVMGRLSDRLGNGRTVLISIVVMVLGVGISSIETLLGKLMGLALITYGFFGAHSAACAWAGKLDDSDKARISSMYMLFYYFGASVVGSLGGKFLMMSGWLGIVLFLSIELSIALSLSVALLRSSRQT